MATVSVATYSTVNGRAVEGHTEVEVSPSVLEVLTAREPAVKEKCFTDLSARSDERAGLDPDHLSDSQTKRQNNRPMPQGNPWEGPRFHFNLVLGTSRADWHGEDIRDEQGRCGLCHGAKLGPGTYCLNCDACGREILIVPDGQPVRTARTDAARLVGLKGGKGAKPEKAMTKKAKKKAAKKAKAAAKKAQATPKFGRWGKAVE